jgi:zinc/manganese transport system substrate-binding protein
VKHLLILASLLVTLTTFGACENAGNPNLKVVTSTSLIEYIVQQVGGSHIEVINMVPPNQHPGNFDVKPGDIEKLANASLFLLHGYPGEAYADRLIESANNPDLTVIKLGVDGNWMIPSIQAAATDKIAGVLSQIDPSNASSYMNLAENYKRKIQAKETAIKNKLFEADITKINVIASTRQADFLEWSGFNVIATFGGTQSLTPQVVKDLVDQGRAANVVLIVNNIQDGQDAGKAIAEELDAENLNLSNFPGGLNDTNTWEKAIDRNVAILLDAVVSARASVK